MLYRHLFLLLLLWIIPLSAANYPELEPKIVRNKINEIMEMHATYKELSPELVKRALENYIEILDPNKTYFIEEDIQEWLNPSDELKEKILAEYNKGQYSAFEVIQERMVGAVQRRRSLEKNLDRENLPKNVKVDEFKHLKWAKNEQELAERIARIKGLQRDVALKVNDDLKEKFLQRIAKQQQLQEEEFMNEDPKKRKNIVLTNVLKATATALDSQTMYFTPAEAAQFMIHVQQLLFGIGAQLRDDLNGLTVVKIIEGGPAYLGKELRVKDRIITINGEPIVGMDISDAIELIRGEENTPVALKVVREEGEGEKAHEETLDITIRRGKVVLKETRYESSFEPYGDGVIAYLRLYSFYQDSDSSSATDLAKEIKSLKEKHKVKGIVLDLRSNTGGLIGQSVAVTGLFITKGVVVSMKDHAGHIQHLRDIDGKTSWDGPLIVLINRMSASASEIVAQTLQDYGRAIVVGDAQSYGKGSYQVFTLNSLGKGTVSPEGEYKVTQGRYYTVSGRTPQLVGVQADIVVPGSLSEMELGEKHAKYPLESDHIKPSFEDDLSDLDIPASQKERLKIKYTINAQPRLTLYSQYLDLLRKNSEERIKMNKNYQAFLKDLYRGDLGESEEESFGQNDLQLTEAYNIAKDLILLLM